MPVETIAVMSPGDMGSAVGAALRNSGLRVITALDGRSERTRELAANSGIEDVGDLKSVVQEADLVLSIMVPDRAEQLAAAIAEEIEKLDDFIRMAPSWLSFSSSPTVMP